MEELQELINNIAYWYEMKYPERELEFYEGTRNYVFENIKSISNFMNMEQLLYRLPHRQLNLVNCNYISNGGGLKKDYNDKNEFIGYKQVIFLSIMGNDKHLLINNKFPKIFILADSNTGEVEIDYELKEYVNGEKITLDQLLELFEEKYSEKIDFSELKQCVYNHNCNIELRKKVLQLVALKLLYSNRTIPERGYERAKRFINEFNKKFGLYEIDEIINRDYTSVKSFQYVKKK